RRDPQSYQTLKYPSKSHPGNDHRHEKMRGDSDPTPPCKVLRRSDSPENRHGDGMSQNRAKAIQSHRVRERDGGTSYSPQENSHNHSTFHSSNSHSNPSKTSDIIPPSYTESSAVDKPATHPCSTQPSPASGLNPSAAPQGSSAPTVPVSPVPQSPAAPPPLLQDPNILRQLLPALQATLQLNNTSVDMSKISEVGFVFLFQPGNCSRVSAVRW
uniref:Uncharacterized protein n=1 Tax=Paramormyrops kingsleyae TaxID=1676925 RepID=A0A3B3SAA1_9TELE